MANRTASAVWNGSLGDGKGHLKTASNVIDVDYTWKARAENAAGTNPEELIAAAHAGCFSMALSHILEGAGFKSTKINTTANVTFDKVGDGFAITKIHLVTEAVVPNLDEAGFKANAEKAKIGCPVSKALAGVPITLDAKLAK